MSLAFLLDTPEFQALVHSLEKGEMGLRISGVTDSAKPYLLACLAAILPQRVVFVRPPSKSLSHLEEGCRFYLSQLDSSMAITSLPALSEDPYLEIPPSLDAVSSRMKTLYGVLRGAPAIVLSHPFGLLKPWPSPGDLAQSFLRLAVGDKVERETLLAMLADFGYTREDLVGFPGEYAWRGGIVDVFSPWQTSPYRIEFGADEILSLREFDSSTQRSLRKLDEILVPSLREYPGTGEFLRAWTALRPGVPAAQRKDFDEKSRFIEQGESFPSFVYLALLVRERFVPYTEYLKDSVFILEDRDEINRECDESLKDLQEHCEELRRSGSFVASPEVFFPPELKSGLDKDSLSLQELDSGDGAKTFAFSFQPVPKFNNRIPFFLEYLRKHQEERDICLIFLSNQGTRKRLAALLEESGIAAVESGNPRTVPSRGEVSLLLGDLEEGFICPREKILVLSEKDIFTEEKVLVSRAVRKTFFSQFQDLQSGDHVVHTDYGVGVFTGLRKIEVDGKNREFIEIRYRDNDKLLVPVEDLNLVQKFSKVGAAAPPLDKLGTNLWQKTKARTKKAAEAIAKELLELYARRKSVKGISFSPQGNWETEFSRVFEFEETDDQRKSILEIMKDMESEVPMDRLLCGDVGYGKTEVAMRAAFKAVMDGKQVAVLCPTTVLASQHLKTFRSRMLLFPVRIEGLTRLQSRREQQDILKNVAGGFVDILVGTHRILSKDVAFRDLGLLIVDEEQRFGVAHKEKIKHLRANIDVLTLTATPIPRTLNMSLTGLRDISLIETPPRDRLAVHTVVTPFSSRLVASAIRQEFNRGGQVYYIHNRVDDIDKITALIEKLVPQAKVISVHGQMAASVLEKHMMDFINRKYNVLLSTTIIENGIDIPLVNTLIVDRADLFGLAQLYQLRGRVGRSSRQAFAYFLVPPLTELSPLAKERLKALKEFSELGSGFRLAAKDLEIRGAGNMLGHSQSGSMEAVGYDYFMQLLDQAIKGLKGEAVEEIKTEIHLNVDIRVPEDYLPQVNLRLNLYKRLSSIDHLDEIEKIRGEIQDRFGDLPASVRNLLGYGKVKHLAQKLKIEAIDRSDNRLLLRFFPTTPVDPVRLPALLKLYSGSLSPDGAMSLALRRTSDEDFLDETIRVLLELSSYTIMS